MSYILKTNFANKSNYGTERSLSVIEYLVLHFTANDGDTDEGNGNYFTGSRGVSAHYFVDSDSVTQSVPDNYVAWSVGGNKYPSCSYTGGGKYYELCTNYNSISIEICDDVRNGVIYPSSKTIQNTIELTKDLMKKYNIPASRVIRHFDVSGKSCPDYWCGTVSKNRKWKTEFHKKLTDNKIKTKAKTTLYKSAYKDPLGKTSNAMFSIPKGTSVKFLKDKGNGWSKVEYKGENFFVLNSNLNKSGLSKLAIGKIAKNTKVIGTSTKSKNKTKVFKNKKTITVIGNITKGEYKGYSYIKTKAKNYFYVKTAKIK